MYTRQVDTEMGKDIRMMWGLADDQHFPHVIASEKELQRGVIMEEIFNMAIIEDALQPELRAMLEAKRVGAMNVVAIIRRIWSGVFRMKESEQVAFRVQHRGDALDHWLHQRLGKVIGNVPAQHCVELHVAEDEIFFEETVDIDSARLRAAAIFRILGKEKNVFVVNAMAEFGEMRDVRRRGWSEVQNGETFCAFEQARELS